MTEITIEEGDYTEEELITLLAQTELKVAQLEEENVKIANAAEKGIAKAWKRVEVLEQQLATAQAEVVTVQRLREGSEIEINNLEDEVARLRKDAQMALLHLDGSRCECGEPLKETDAADTLRKALEAGGE